MLADDSVRHPNIQDEGWGLSSRATYVDMSYQRWNTHSMTSYVGHWEKPHIRNGVGFFIWFVFSNYYRSKPGELDKVLRVFHLKNMKNPKLIKPEPRHIRGVCVTCGKNPQKKISGKESYNAECTACNYKRYEKPETRLKRLEADSKRVIARNRSYRSVVGDQCEKCGFIPEHKCQLDVDHIDENHSNNNPSNLQTLCANCHRLKSHLARTLK